MQDNEIINCCFCGAMLGYKGSSGDGINIYVCPKCKQKFYFDNYGNEINDNECI